MEFYHSLLSIFTENKDSQALFWHKVDPRTPESKPSESRQFPLVHYPLLGMHHISQRIRCVVTAQAIFVTIHLQHILRTARVVLQIRQAFDQPRASFMNV